jgi:hypothetical protein
MKKVLFIAVAIAATLAFVSCKKCVTCSYEYYWAPDGGNKLVTYPQECGTTKQINVYKDNVEADANIHGVKSTCTKD